MTHLYIAYRETDNSNDKNMQSWLHNFDLKI